MNTYTIDNNKTSEKFEKQFKSMDDARHWVINTLDLSKEWNIFLLSEGDTKKENDKPEMFDEKIQALGKHLDLNNEDLRMIEESGDYLSFGDKQFLVLTDDEAEKKWDEHLDSYIEECLEIPEHLRFYFDDEKWKDDARMDGRGHSLSSYDGDEHEIKINETEYFIYRTN